MTINTFKSITSDTRIYYNVYLKEVNTYEGFEVDYLTNEMGKLAASVRKRDTFKKARVTNIGYNKARGCIQVDAEI